jgi:transcriptional regulator with XRE-family HTH domain
MALAHERTVLRVLLRQARMAAKLTQSELGARVDKDQAYVSRYEIGESQLDFVEVDVIARGLNLTLEEIVQRYQERLAKQR